LTKLAQSALLAAIFAFTIAAAAQTLTGTVTNGTTNKPAAGDEVILINLTTTMEVAASTKADSSGKSVSYTHIDVYKRQVLPSGSRTGRGNNIPRALEVFSRTNN